MIDPQISNHFPSSTYYGKRMPKEKFYAHLEVSAASKRSFIDDIDSFVWQNKLSASTLNIEIGQKVKEIALFEVNLKQEDCSLSVFDFIDRHVSVYVVYLLKYKDTSRLLINYKEPSARNLSTFRIIDTFITDWSDNHPISLSIQGLNLDTIYDNFVRQIAGGRLLSQPTANLSTDIEKEHLRTKIEKQITLLEAKKTKEKQFKRQIELSAEIKKLKEQLSWI